MLMLITISSYWIGPGSTCSYSLTSYDDSSSSWSPPDEDFGCVNNQTYVVNNVTLVFQISIGSYCSIHVAGIKSIVVEVSTVHYYNNVSSYFYISHSHVCHKNFTLVSSSDTPCKLRLWGNSFQFHFRNVSLSIRIEESNDAVSICAGTESVPDVIDSVPCHYVEYDNYRSVNTEYDQVIVYYDPLTVTFNWVDYNPNTRNCKNNLGFKVITSICLNELEDFREFIIYENEVISLSFKNRDLHVILNEAFTGMNGLLHLELSVNYISLLYEKSFKDLGNLKYLGLIKNSLVSLSQRVFEPLMSLVSLDLESNLLTTLATGVFGNLRHLRYLDIQYNRLPSIEDRYLFHNSTELHKLILSDNYITTLHPKIFSKLTKLESLFLYKNTLSHLPAGVFDSLRELRKLYLTSNRIQYLDESLFVNNIKLEMLYLNFNPLDRLPPRLLSSQSELKKISVAHTNIRVLEGQFISHLTQLYNLELSHNHLSSISASIFSSLSRLETLSLQKNVLRYLPPDVFKTVHNLEILYLHENRLTVLEFDRFTELGELRTLTVSNNEIEAVIPFDQRPLLSNLTKLYLSFNRISELSKDVLTPLESLSHLSIGYNRLVRIHTDIFINLVNIRYLNVEFNHMKEPPLPQIQTLHKLTHLYLSGNQIDQLLNNTFASQVDLLVLSLRYSSIKYIEANCFANLNKLRGLYLQGNLISYLPTTVFQQIINRAFTLDVSFNRLASLSTEFNGLTELNDIFLNNNEVLDLGPKVFASLTKVRVINLAYNKIEQMPDYVFISNTKLAKIILRHNKLTQLNGKVFTFNTTSRKMQLRLLDLSYNRLSTITSDCFKHVGAVRRLKVDNNELSIVNDTFSYPIINRIRLYNNQLVNLQPGMLSSNLDILVARNNSISKLAENVFESNLRLMIIDLSLNKLQHLSMSVFLQNPLLRIVDVSQNNITQFEIDPSALHELVDLNMSRNGLKIFPNIYFLSSLIVLDLSFNQISTARMDHETVENPILRLEFLFLNNNNITELFADTFEGMRNLLFLDLSINRIDVIDHKSFWQHKKLIQLRLNHNVITYIDDVAFIRLINVRYLELQHNKLTVLSAFVRLTNLLILNVSYNSLEQIHVDSFHERLQILDLRMNQLLSVGKDSFQNLQETCKVICDKKSTCCFISNAVCISKQARSGYVTCTRMLQSVFLRVTMWLVGVATVFANCVAFMVRMAKKNASRVQNHLLLHLSMADFLMGVNLILISIADAYYNDYFPSFSDEWRNSALCKFAGAISILSSEASVFFICFISIDRYLGIKHPFKFSNRTDKKSGRLLCLLIWLCAIALSVIPVTLSKFNKDVYDVSEVCIGLPITKRPSMDFKYTQTGVRIITMKMADRITSEGSSILIHDNIFEDIDVFEVHEKYANISTINSIVVKYRTAPVFSIVIFVGLNFLCFLCALLCYVLIFVEAQKSGRTTMNTNKSREKRMAMRMFTIVFTDFLCWVPISVASILVQAGAFSVSPHAYAWIVGFVLPINSTINPFLYTIGSYISDKMGERTKS